jgi:hypothetical protein
MSALQKTEKKCVDAQMLIDVFFLNKKCARVKKKMENKNCLEPPVKTFFWKNCQHHKGKNFSDSPQKKCGELDYFD